MKKTLLATLLALSLPAVHAADLQQAIAAFEAGKTPEAKTLFQAALAEPALAAQAHGYLGRIAQREGDEEEAQKAFEQALKLDTGNADYVFRLGTALCNQAQSASMFSALGLAKDCVKQFDKAAQLAPDNLDYQEALFDFYLSAPGIAGGDEDKAKVLAEAMQKRDTARGLAMKAQLALKNEEYVSAETLMKAALDQAKDKSDYRFQLGMLYQQAKRYDDAIATFSTLSKEQPDAYQALYQIGRTAVLSKAHLEEGELALLAYCKSPEDAKRPSHAWAHYRLGLIYELMGKKDAGKAEYQLAAKDTGDEQLQDALDKVL